jgi:coenzyme F420-reducing hydrogenase beta subunit
MKNIVSIKNCYGCGVCAIVCPEKIITIDLNSDGFYEPRIIDEKACKECGLCVTVCAYADDKVMSVGSSQPVAYAAWSKDKGVRAVCSSGGIGFEIGKHLIERGYKACGVRYNAETNRAEHFLSSTVEDFKPSIGSKYIQSYTLPGFEMLNRNDKFLITGTPCQIDSMRRYIRALKMENNFVLMDFFCHGVPSMLLWQKYTEKVERQTGKITSAVWRDKRGGWHNSWAMVIAGEKKKDYYSRKSDGDLFYRFFLGNLCLNKACYDRCKYKMTSSAADIRIGDLWGTTYKSDDAGVSALLAFSEKGKYLVEALTNCDLKTQPVPVAAEGQMRYGVKRPAGYRYVKRCLNEGGELTAIAKRARLIRIALNIHKILFNRFIKLWKKL